MKTSQQIVITVWLWIFTPGLLNFTDGSYTIRVPVVYVAFSGDLVINYSIPTNVSIPNAFIRILADSNPGRKEITTRGLPLGESSGDIVVRCGIIEFAAPHVVELHTYAGGPILTTTSLDVQWPSFHLQIQKTHIAQTKPVSLILTSNAICRPLLKRYSFQVDLVKVKNNTKDSFQIGDQQTLVHSAPILDITKQRQEIIYTCDIFDAEGKFKAILLNSFNKKSVIAQSGVMVVSWSQMYTVDIYSPSVFPCTGRLSVLYQHPECVGNNDKIRMYMLSREGGSIAAPLKRSYVTERKADPKRSYSDFSCSVFNSSAVGYCFVYVSMSKSGAVSEQKSSCMSTHPDSVLPIDGGWNHWSQWGSCSVTCGAGKVNRFRMCNNPPPAHGGQFCPGEPIEWRPCFITCPELIPKTPLHTLLLNASCVCGCHLNGTAGEIIATGRCKGLSRWLISVEENRWIKLSFKYFNLLEKKQWVRIRNGGTSSADLLAVSYGDVKLDDVYSTSNIVLIEFMTLSNSSAVNASYIRTTSSPQALLSYPSEIIHVYGFIAAFTVHVRNTTRVVAAVAIPQKPSKDGIWQSAVTIVGISLCAVIVIIVIIFAIYHKVFHKKLHKYSMATQEETPTHVPKSISMHSTPSRHSAVSQGIEIDYDMERPLTGNSVRKKERKNSDALISRGSSISSNKSVRSKNKFKTKADIEPGGSPRPPSRHYTPLPSPLIHNDIVDEVINESSLFNTSPLVNRKSRSPKIHPSPRFKRQSGGNSPVKSKHELLIRKRKDRSTKDKESSKSKQNSASSDSKIHRKTTKEIKQTTPTPDSSGSMTPTPATLNFTKMDETEVIKDLKSEVNDKNTKEEAIPLKDIDKEDIEARKPGSGTSDDSCTPDKVEVFGQQTTSFVQSPSIELIKLRRPTSLTESYKKSTSLPSIDRVIASSEELQRADRQSALPKPDGQSPKSPRQDNSKNSTPKSVPSSSVNSSQSKLTLSPARSATSPSENLEMEYDDYIEYDDTFSYFDPLETEKLQWKGSEKIGSNKVSKNDPKTASGDL